MELSIKTFNVILLFLNFKIEHLKLSKNYFLYELKIFKNKWLVSKARCKDDKNFYFVNNNKINNHVIYFLSNEKEIKTMIRNNFSELVDLNDFTDTDPPYRANLSIMLAKKKRSFFISV